jgi:arginine/lysine/ornithine decarboxylase
MKMPIWEMLQAYKERQLDRFHMPGHKGQIDWLPGIGEYDVTETSLTDNLYHEQGLFMKPEN